MEDKKLNISNMNGTTDDASQTCGITDMNCVENGSETTAASITNMNSISGEDDKTCGITDMNCLGNE